MIGDLSIAPPSAVLDLAPNARRAFSGPVHPNTRDVVSQPLAGANLQPSLPPANLQASAPPAGRQVEAARLKALLTDPSVQVSTQFDDASGRIVLRVQRLMTGDVVEQIPSEALLRLYATLRESLVDERA